MKHFVWYEQFVCVWATLDFVNLPLLYFPWGIVNGCESMQAKKASAFHATTVELENQKYIFLFKNEAHNLCISFAFIHMRATFVEV